MHNHPLPSWRFTVSLARLIALAAAMIASLILAGPASGVASARELAGSAAAADASVPHAQLADVSCATGSSYCLSVGRYVAAGGKLQVLAYG